MKHGQNRVPHVCTLPRLGGTKFHLEHVRYINENSDFKNPQCASDVTPAE